MRCRERSPTSSINPKTCMLQGRRVPDTATCTYGPGNAILGTIYMLFEAYNARRMLLYPGGGDVGQNTHPSEDGHQRRKPPEHIWMFQISVASEDACRQSRGQSGERSHSSTHRCSLSTGSYTMSAHPSKMEPHAHPMGSRYTCQPPTECLHLLIGSTSGARHNCADRPKTLFPGYMH